MKKDKKQTFVVQVMEQQNDSWQGSVTLADTNETIFFRSALELMHMIDDVISQKDA